MPFFDYSKNRCEILSLAFNPIWAAIPAFNSKTKETGSREAMIFSENGTVLRAMLETLPSFLRNTISSDSGVFFIHIRIVSFFPNLNSIEWVGSIVSRCMSPFARSCAWSAISTVKLNMPLLVFIFSFSTIIATFWLFKHWLWKDFFSCFPSFLYKCSSSKFPRDSSFKTHKVE